MAPIQRMTETQLRQAVQRSPLPEPLLKRLSLMLDQSTETEYVAGTLPVDYLRRTWTGRLARSSRPPDGLRESVRELAFADLPELSLVVVDSLGLQAHLVVCGGVLTGCVIGVLPAAPEEFGSEL